MRICTLGSSGDRVSQLKIELLPVGFGTARMGSKPGWISKNLKLFRILGVYSGFFAFIGAHKRTCTKMGGRLWDSVQRCRKGIYAG
jgi:hypothetical protein